MFFYLTDESLSVHLCVCSTIYCTLKFFIDHESFVIVFLSYILLTPFSVFKRNSIHRSLRRDFMTTITLDLYLFSDRTILDSLSQGLSSPLFAFVGLHSYSNCVIPLITFWSYLRTTIRCATLWKYCSFTYEVRGTPRQRGD